jgi:hypothetical protein
MEIKTILAQIDIGTFALPEFQRGYVWNRDQVRKMITSLYKGYPIGSLLVWTTKTDGATVRGDGAVYPGTVKLILDGQQRITSLYGIIRGVPPKFFDGNSTAFTGLYFNLKEQEFEFFSPLKMKDNPFWINVTELMKSGSGVFIGKIYSLPDVQNDIQKYIDRLNQLDRIKDIDLFIQDVVGEDKTIDVVVDIFNNVNSGGTKLSKGDLALAKICGEWSDARNEMKNLLSKWTKAGFNFKLEWLLRNITTHVTGDAYFSALKDIKTEQFKSELKESEKAIDFVLNLISSRLGLDHDRVLGSRYSIPLILRLIKQNPKLKSDLKSLDKILYWYIHTFLWGRYAGSTESVLSQDLNIVESQNKSIDDLIQMLRQNRADLKLSPQDFSGWSTGARFYPLLYMLTRVCHTRDLMTNIELTNHLLGKMSSLEVHHIFPKAQLYKLNYSRAEVNALSNYTFLTKDTNLYISDRLPSDYLKEFSDKNPGVLESHWIPTDEYLWKIENYLDFMEARKKLLAKAANDFLNQLYSGSVKESEIQDFANREVITTTDILGGIADEEEESIIKNINEWILSKGLPAGEFQFELIFGENKTAIIDLAWPDGIQTGLSKPVAFILNEEKELEEILNKAGFTFYTDSEDLKKYITNEILGSINTD